jgi:uncharacterized zinc-type alcohol dehydrogenase-like protein
MTVKGYACMKPKEKLIPYDFELNDEVEDKKVRIKITHCGLCHSDLHLINNDWDNENIFPLVPGHEIVGEVYMLGKNVKKFKNGERVGVGWQCESCGICKSCKSGFDNICKEMKATCVDQKGGFAEYIDIDENFVFKIPENLTSEFVAPLFCAGITVYNPLEYYNVRPWMRVGVIGLGGLGHLAVQFLKAYGCEVDVFSSSKEKETLSKQLGASNHITDIYNQDLDFKYDFILSTASVALDWKRYVNILAPRGKICFVGAIPEDISLDFFELMMYQKEVVAGSIGSPWQIEQMLDFASRHKIAAQIELFKLAEINDALEKMKEGELRFRAVMEI